MIWGEATALYNQFKGSPPHFSTTSPRCKVVPFEEFNKRDHWLVERAWSEEERRKLSFVNESPIVGEAEFEEAIKELQAEIAAVTQDTIYPSNEASFKEVSLGDDALFKLAIGDRVLKKNILSSGIPVYSANVSVPFGYIEKSNIEDFSHPSLLWGIDGIFDWGYVPQQIPFANTDHCGVLNVLSDALLPRYVFYTLRATKDEYGFDSTFRANLANMKALVRLKIPTNDKGEFDIAQQQHIVNRYDRLAKIKEVLGQRLQSLSETQVILD